jgi:hypothetical protein
MSTVDDALFNVDQNAAGRTRYAGQGEFIDEVLAAEVRRLREQLANSERRRAAKDTLIILRTMQRDDALTALDGLGTEGAKKGNELRFQFEAQVTME